MSYIKLALPGLALQLASSEHLDTSKQVCRGGGGSRVVRGCVYIYINCPLKNVTQMGYVLQGILMRCILHFRVVAIRLL